ncbi:hypothetical protein Lbir_0109 [Legionella birminghamensis]|uniref:Uncharacterized conserved protein n=1 Tax=Legionella birminghamensis TaxID=28083 RepID=A0A378I6H2_9GAMM|nr:hypothetical protein [Legionella birminghamensis]KTC76040.1 hypothetical protein Lbir_0109 [Legionella birminghamensis]STX30797.1 Uncharacterized conserved protein [Legionella birminghamensis]
MYLPDLNDLKCYKNARIISRYNTDYPDAKMQAEEALSELMKFIWLCMKHKSDKKANPNNDSLNFSCLIHSEMAEIDNMWHTFLLFTKDYQHFCQTYLGGIFFHHEPVADTENNTPNDDYEQELTRYLSYIYDNLGEETVLKWFAH